MAKKRKMIPKFIRIPEAWDDAFNDIVVDAEQQGERTTQTEVIRLALYRFLVSMGKIGKK